MNRTWLVSAVPALLSGCLVGDPNPDGTGGAAYDTGGTAAASGGSWGSGGSEGTPSGVARGSNPIGFAIEPGLSCSGTSATAVQVVFQNDYPARNLDLYWVDTSCNEILYASIGAGTSYQQATYSDHPWRLREQGVLLHEYVPTNLAYQVVPLP